MRLRLILTVWLAFSGNAAGQSFQDSLQNEHIQANVPSEDVFSTFLDRDILTYLQSEVSADIAAVETALLRQGATQSGVAYPKFYLWVVATSNDGTVLEGAARAAAVDRIRFEVTDFLSAEEIGSDPQAVSSVFPASLVSDIMTRAMVK